MGGWNILDELDYWLRYKYGPWPLVLLIIVGVLAAAWLLWPRPGAAVVYVKVNVKGEGLVNGSRTLEFGGTAPFTVTLVARPAKYWRLAYWVVNGTRVGSEPTLELTVKANTTVTAVFERTVCVLRVEANATSAAALIDGRKVSLPFEAEFPCGSKVSVEPVALEGYRALNGSSTLTLESNTTVRLLYERVRKGEREQRPPPLPACSGVLLAANVENASVRVNGVLTGLPNCVEPPAEVEGDFYVPINETHGYWLAWYLVELANGTRYWWSPTLNGSKLKVDQPANVTLHYVLGLKGLPYVKSFTEWPPDWADYYDAWAEDGWIAMRALKEYMGGGYVARALITLPRDIGLVVVEFSGYGKGITFTLLPLWGQNYLFVPEYNINPRYRGVRAALFEEACWVNVSVHLMYWKERVKMFGLRPPLDVFLGPPPTPDEKLLKKYYSQMWICAGRQEEGIPKRGFAAGGLRTRDLKSIEILPDTGDWGLVIKFSSTSTGYVLKVRIVGVAPP